MEANGRKILLVEDETGLAQLEREVLEESGFHVIEVDQGQQALERLENGDELSLIVLDYRLPDMTGGDVVAALDQRIDALPVVIVTGFPDPEIKTQMLDAGVRDYIIKDIGMSFLDNLPQVAHTAIEGLVSTGAPP